MKIGVILYPYGEKNPAGLAETIYRFSESLVAVNTTHTFRFFSKGDNLPTPSFLLGQSQHEFQSLPPTRLWLDTAYKNNPDIDVWVYNMPILPFFHTPKKSVTILADFGYLELESRSWKQYLMKQCLFLVNYLSLRKTTHAVTISEFTRSQALRLFGRILSPRKVTTVWAGYRTLSDIKAVPPTLPLPDFYLSIGVIKERKKSVSSCESFSKS